MGSGQESDSSRVVRGSRLHSIQPGAYPNAEPTAPFNASQSTLFAIVSGDRIAPLNLVCFRGLPLSASSVPPTRYASVRRSQRVWFTSPIRVSGSNAAGTQWSEETSTLIVSAHGALILLEHSVVQDQTLTLSRLNFPEERACRVAMVGKQTGGMLEVGLELLGPYNNFWNVPNPPADWANFNESWRPASVAPK